MVQREVAERIVASPGTRRYGIFERACAPITAEIVLGEAGGFLPPRGRLGGPPLVPRARPLGMERAAELAGS